MTFYGLSSYDRCKKLMELFQKKNMSEISKSDLKNMIAIHIGSSQFYKTITRYTELMQALGMIKPKDVNTFTLNYDCLKAEL